MDNQLLENNFQKNRLRINLMILLIITGLNQYVSGQNLVEPDSTRIVVTQPDSVFVDFEKNKGELILLEDSVYVNPEKSRKEIKQLEKALKKAENDTIVHPKHSPRKATIYAAIMPGLGQLYNKQYFKAPLVYIGFGAFIYFVNWNNNEYIKYKQAFIDISDDDPSSKSYENLGLEGKWDLTNPSHIAMLTTRLDRAKEFARRNRDLCIIGTAAFYAVSIIEATVSGHFFDFDVSEDLAFNWGVKPIQCMDQMLIGVGVTITFKN